jgi:LEA14-like dessication related protein
VFPNLVNAQLSKELKQHIENNDASSIQLKFRTQVEVALEKVPINGEHIHV